MKLWESGTLGVVDVRSITAQERLDAEDVGADEVKSSRSIVRLGVKTLFSKEQLEPLRKAENAARQALYLHSLSFPIGGLRFIPNDSMPKMQARLDAALQEHREAVAMLKLNFDQYKREMLAEYPDQLEEKDYERTRSLLWSGRCDIRLSTFNLDLSGGSKEKEVNILSEFTEQTVRDLRETIVVRANQIVKSLSEGKRFSERTLKAMQDLVTRSRDANFVNDPVTTQTLDLLQQELDKRSAKQIRQYEDEALSFRRSLEAIAETASATDDIGSVVSGFVGRMVQFEEPIPVEPIVAPTSARVLDLAI